MAQCDPKRFLIGVDISGDSKVTGNLEVTGNLVGQEFRRSFNIDTDWVAQTTTPETYKLTIEHLLTTMQPETSVFMPDSNEVDVCVAREDLETVSITVFADERFAGYIIVRK